jgi:hypothetical protein
MKKKSCGSFLDVDANANGSNLITNPVEKIGWDELPIVNEVYKVFVHYYAIHDKKEINTKFKVKTLIFGESRVYSSNILPEEKSLFLILI